MKKKILWLSALCILIVAISWITNMGWIRFFLTFLMVPVIHALVFFWTNYFSAKYCEIVPNLKKLTWFFMLTYLLPYLLTPDGGDIGGIYFFFGLVKNDTLANIANYIAGIALSFHIALFVVMIMEIRKGKKAKNTVNTEDTNEA